MKVTEEPKSNGNKSYAKSLEVKGKIEPPMILSLDQNIAQEIFIDNQTLEEGQKYPTNLAAIEQSRIENNEKS